jgi:sialate O-acetylesterase
MRALLLSYVLVAVVGVSVPNIYASHMVFARDVPNTMWGYDKAGSKVTMSFASVSVSATTQQNGIWMLAIPPQKASVNPVSITLTSSIGPPSLVLDDILFGEIFVCSGQSNMQLTVDSTVNRTQYIAESANFGPTLRILQVALVDAFENVTVPQATTTLSIPWSRAAPQNVGPMSAVCYYFGREAVIANPQVPIGLLASSWGGTAINVWMDPTSVQACGGGFNKETSFRNPDPGLRYLKGMEQVGFPTHDSCLYNSMIVPLQFLRVTGMLWYQGESNAGDPVGYARCFPAMIKQWRSAWDTLSGVSSVAPFFFVQISSWAAGDGGVIATQRIAQEAALAVPRVGMAVAADIGDPASPVHPIHPIMKQEVARRLFLAARNILYNQSQIPAEGPRVQKVVLDTWDPSWGDYHQGVGVSDVCYPGTGFFCVGIRVFFDQPLVLHPSYQTLNGNPANFELLISNGATQPVGLTGVNLSNPSILQLNVTIVNGPVEKAVLRYGWRDYPTMPLTNAAGQPAPSFNISISG